MYSVTLPDSAEALRRTSGPVETLIIQKTLLRKWSLHGSTAPCFVNGSSRSGKGRMEPCPLSSSSLELMYVLELVFACRPTQCCENEVFVRIQVQTKPSEITDELPIQKSFANDFLFVSTLLFFCFWLPSLISSDSLHGTTHTQVTVSVYYSCALLSRQVYILSF